MNLTPEQFDEVRMGPSQDGAHCSVLIPGMPELTLTTSQVDAAIKGLARTRERMRPSIDHAQPTLQAAYSAFEANPTVQPWAGPNGEVAVAVRTRGLGWIMFTLTPLATAQLLQATQAAVARAPGETPEGQH